MTSGTLLSSCLVVGIGREWRGAAVRTLRSMVNHRGGDTARAGSSLAVPVLPCRLIGAGLSSSALCAASSAAWAWAVRAVCTG